MKGFKKVSILIWTLLLLTSLNFSQAGRGKGRISGMVTDNNDNPMNGVAVSAKSLEQSSRLKQMPKANSLFWDWVLGCGRYQPK